MAKIVGISKTTSKNGKDYYTYFFVASDDSVNGFFTGEINQDHELLNPDTNKPLTLDDTVSVRYTVNQFTGISKAGKSYSRYIRNYFLGDSKSF